MTSIKAGPSPLQKALTPPLFNIYFIVSAIPIFFVFALVSTEVEEDGMVLEAFIVWTVWDACMTQIGLLMMVVAEPSFEKLRTSRVGKSETWY